MSETTDPLRLAELLAARMSHDLAGAIGTLAAALELASDETPDPGESMVVAGEAADELRSRLRLLRAAWGPTDNALDLVALRALAEGLPRAHRLTIDLAALPANILFSPGMARLILNLLLLAGEGMPAGGVVTLSGTATDVVVGIAGPRAAWPPDIAHCLASEANAWAAVQDARKLQMPLTALLARSLGLRLSLPAPGDPDFAPPKLRLSES